LQDWQARSGLALLLSFAVRLTRRNEASPIGLDPVGVFSLVALVWGRLSFFELP
jgi:hypothetical protein